MGVVEPKPALAAQYAQRFHLPASLLFSDLEEMLKTAKPEGVMVFTSTFEHVRVVETCARHGVHVMMEKPLAVSMEHARAIQQAARRSSIHVLVNYETTWYPSHELAYALVRRQGAVGELRKIVVRDGHQGPKEIGCPESFLSWLTDPVLNGGGRGDLYVEAFIQVPPHISKEDELLWKQLAAQATFNPRKTA